MLVLSRKVGERIQVGDDVTVTIVRINANSVRIGIEAPLDTVITREELIPPSLSLSKDEPRGRDLSIHVEKSTDSFHVG